MRISSLISLLILVSFNSISYGETIGASLLRAFQCESLGSETASIRSSIQNLKDTVKSIDDNNGVCKSVKSSIAQLPSIDDVTRRLEEDSELKRVRELEANINEALANINYINEVSPSERHLYPSKSQLEGIVVTSRSELLQLKSSLSVAEGRLNRQNQIRGIAELDRLGGRLADAISNNPECFEGKNDIKRHSLTALVGITGYFLSEPVGVATTVAARNLQNLFRIFGSKESRFLKSMEPVIKAELGLGFGCALESLSEQHCNLNRKKRLLSELGKKKTEADYCAHCEEALIKSKNLTNDLKSISDWISLRDKIGDSSNPEVSKARAKARKAAVEISDEEIEAISSTISTAKTISSGTQKEKLLFDQAISTLESMDNLLIKGQTKQIQLGSLSKLQLQGDTTEQESYSRSLGVLLGDQDVANKIHNSLYEM